MQPVRTNHIGDPAEFARAFDVSRETLARLMTYERLLRTWQKTINLVAPRTLDDVWHRHFADSAQVVGIARAALAKGDAIGTPAQSEANVGTSDRPRDDASGLVRWVDLGSGGGFPGLVAGILWAETGKMHLQLVDSDQRKAAFLREVVRETGLKRQITVDIVAGRIETAANHSTCRGVTTADPVDVVSARALAPLPKLLDWAEPYFGARTVGIFLKGRDADAELAAVSSYPRWSFETRPSLTDSDAQVVVARRQS